MQNLLFDEPTQVGLYIQPKPMAQGATPLALVQLQKMLDGLRPILRPSRMFENPWLFEYYDPTWSFACATYLLVAVEAPSDEAFALKGAPQKEAEIVTDLMLRWKAPARALEMSFAALCKPAGAAEWPQVCTRCHGHGWRDCCAGQKSFCEECFQWEGAAPCQRCGLEGCIAPAERIKTLVGRRVDVNLMACAFETLAPAVARESSARVWPHRRAQAICCEGAGWRLLVMALPEQTQ